MLSIISHDKVTGNKTSRDKQITKLKSQPIVAVSKNRVKEGGYL